MDTSVLTAEILFEAYAALPKPPPLPFKCMESVQLYRLDGEPCRSLRLFMEFLDSKQGSIDCPFCNGLVIKTRDDVLHYDEQTVIMEWLRPYMTLNTIKPPEPALGFNMIYHTQFLDELLGSRHGKV